MARTPSLTTRLVDLIEHRPIDQKDLDAAALLTLDLIANAIGARNTEAAQKVAAWSGTTGGDAGRRAFLLGAFAHTLEMDDLHRTSVTHPGCVVIPAAWSQAQKQGAAGHALLKAVTRGFEAVCRVGASVGPAHYEVWHNTATCGPFGSAVAVASLLGLPREAQVDALGNAGTQASGLWEFLNAGAESKHLHAGRAAEAGLAAAQLAAFGFTGPATILEGEKGFYRSLCPDAAPESLLEGADSPWQTHMTSLKPWPSCRHTHPAIDAAGDLQPAFDPDAVERIDVETYGAALKICDRPAPKTDYDAKFSLQHCVAAALTEPNVTFETFSETARQELSRLTDKVHVAVGEYYEDAYPNTWGASVTVTPKEGDPVAARRTFAKGDPQAALSRDEIIEKADMLMRHGGLADPVPLIDSILDLARDGAVPALPLPLFHA
ncbi:MAG: MmgE/PrpD family protein [Alphaproteobacteria bacterium]